MKNRGKLDDGRKAAPPTHRERILNSATDCFFDLGFERASTAEIARRARISKREIYTCFKTKKEILSAVINRVQEEMYTSLGELWSSSGDLDDVLPKAARILHSFIVSEQFGKILRIVAAESFHSPELAKRFYELGPNRGRKDAAKYFRYQMKQGNLVHTDPIQAADDFLDLVVGAQLLNAVMMGQTPKELSRQNRAEHAVEVFLKNYAATS